MKIIGLLPKVRGSQILDQFFSMFLKHNCFIFSCILGTFLVKGATKLRVAKGDVKTFFVSQERKHFSCREKF